RAAARIARRLSAAAAGPLLLAFGWVGMLQSYPDSVVRIDEEPSMDFDHTYDVVVVGTGAAAFATALGAVDEGLSVILLESTAKWGGNSAMSGGGMWVPNNPLMQRDGVGDSREEALAYLEATVGDAGRATSRERKEAFVDGVADFVATAQKHGMKLVRSPDYPDYYPERPGGKIGRGLEH